MNIQYPPRPRFAAILIEVEDGVAFVNGKPVEPLDITLSHLE